MLNQSTALQTPQIETRYTISIARTEHEIISCQKLRYDVFATEMGANIKTKALKIDYDHFDLYAKHIMVKDIHHNKVIATTRVLNNISASDAGLFYSQTEFNISNILCMNKNFMEIGRTCVHKDYRTTPAINLLWQGVARLMQNDNSHFMFGCVSIPLTDKSNYVHTLMKYLNSKHMAPANLRVNPLTALPEPESFAALADIDVVVPSLLRRYLSLGAMVCGDPCYDPLFHVADIFVLVDKTRINRRYQKHFFGQ